MTDNITQWAWAEAGKRVRFSPLPTSNWEWSVYADNLRDLAASLIAQHEEPPVDPMLIEARELAAKHYEQVGSYILADATRSGERDSLGLIKVIAEALRRGIELGKAGAA